MAIELGTIGKQAAELWAKLGKLQRALVVVAAAAVLGAAGFFALYTPPEAYAVLYSNLPAEDAGQVIETLRTQQVPYRVGKNGTTIEVPEARVHELRMTLAASGTPKSGGPGYELFDKQSFGSTSLVEHTNYIRALSGELARSISTLEPVESARVLLALKQPSLYKKDEEPASASVVVKLRRGRELNPQQVKGIVNLIARSVEGLVAERIAVVDDSGNALWSGVDEVDARTNEEGRELERRLKQRVSALTDSVVGKGHSVVVVTAEIDTAQKEETRDIFDKDRTAIRSQTESEEKSGDALGGSGSGGVAGARGNLPGAGGGQPTTTQTLASSVQGSAGGAAFQGRSSRQSVVNYEPSRVREHIVGPKSRISRLHVAVLIDASRIAPSTAQPPPPPVIKTSTLAATATTATATRAPAAAATAIAQTSTPTAPTGRQRFTLGEIGALASAAAGLDPARGDRIEVQAIPFADDEQAKAAPEPPAPSLFAELPFPAWYLAAGAGALLAVGMAVGGLVLVRRRRREKAEQALVPEVLNAQPMLPLTASEMEHALESGKPVAAPEPLQLPSLTPRERAIEAVRADTARAARVLAAWLAQPSEEVGAAGGDS